MLYLKGQSFSFSIIKAFRAEHHLIFNHLFQHFVSFSKNLFLFYINTDFLLQKW